MTDTWPSWHEVAIAPPKEYTRLTYVDHPDNCDVYGDDNGRTNPGRFVPKQFYVNGLFEDFWEGLYGSTYDTTTEAEKEFPGTGEDEYRTAAVGIRLEGCTGHRQELTGR